MANTAGKQFEKDMLTSLRSMGHWAERFRDNTWSDMSGSTASPPDMICVINQRPVLLEMKALGVGYNQRTHEPRSLLQGSISLKRCDGHQRQRLLDFERVHNCKGYVVVMFYTPRSQRRCAVMIPIETWVGAQDMYGVGSIRLDALRKDLSPSHHLKWVGRKAKIGPYDICSVLGASPEEDLTIR